MRIVVGITGASGAVYGVRLLECLQQAKVEVHAIVSEAGWQVLDYECGLKKSDIQKRAVKLYDVNNMAAAVASGSFHTDAMVIAPCSMRTLGLIANGVADNLIGRSADVMLKEARPLILVPRETPLSAIHLGNMLRLAQLGVRIMPACPGYYHQPNTIDDLVNMMVGKILDMLKIEHQLYHRWQGIN